VSENERRVAAQKGPAFRIYRLFGFGTDPKVYWLPGPLEAVVSLEPIAYRARVGLPLSGNSGAPNSREAHVQPLGDFAGSLAAVE
jgi:hypothetical protein